MKTRSTNSTTITPHQKKASAKKAKKKTMTGSANVDDTDPNNDGVDNVVTVDTTSQPTKKHDEEETAGVVKVEVVDSSVKGNDGTVESENVNISGVDCMKITPEDASTHELLEKGIDIKAAKFVNTGEICVQLNSY